MLETPQPQKTHPGPRSQHSSGQLPQYFLQHNQGRSFGPGNPCGQSLEHKQNREKSLQPLTYKVICIKVQRAELTCHLIKTCSICVKNIWIFARFLKLLRSCWEKSRKTWGDTEKNKEKLEANCTGFSVSRNVLFCQENKNSNVVNFLLEPVFSQALFS